MLITLNKEWLKRKNEVSKFYIVARSTKLMAIRKQLHDVLALIAELGHNNLDQDILHVLVIDRMRLPEHETHRYIHELEDTVLIWCRPFSVLFGSAELAIT